MNKYCVCFTCYRKVGRSYENQIAMSFVVSDSKEGAYTEALNSRSSELLADSWMIGMHLEMEIPENYLKNELERVVNQLK